MFHNIIMFHRSNFVFPAGAISKDKLIDRQTSDHKSQEFFLVMSQNTFDI